MAKDLDDAPGPLARRLAARLLESGKAVSLDAIAEALGRRAGSPPHINALIERLEVLGASIETGDLPDLRGLLARVLGCARGLRARSLSPSVDAIALELGLEPRLVRVALLYGEVLMRGRPAESGGLLH